MNAIVRFAAPAALPAEPGAIEVMARRLAELAAEHRQVAGGLPLSTDGC